MINFIKVFLSFLLTLEISSIFSLFYENDFSVHSCFLVYYIALVLFNLSFNIIINEKLDIDLFYKYLYFLSKTPNFSLNYFINTLKKIYIFLIHFKYKFIISTSKILLIKYSNSLFLIWRPLFKKSSYFGYYRSNRSKWIK